jgi:hypothetical protein
MAIGNVAAKTSEILPLSTQYSRGIVSQTRHEKTRQQPKIK